jgi:Ankyrin repeats (3 copies)
MLSNSGQFQQLAVSKRKRKLLDLKTRDHPIGAKREAPCPVSFLRSLFASSAQGEQLMAKPSRMPFQKPSQAEINAYDLEAVQAIRASDVKKLRSLLKEGKTMNASNRFGESLIAMACRRGDVDVVRFMIQEANVRLDIQDDYGRTPLHDCCWTTEPNMVSFFVGF